MAEVRETHVERDADGRIVDSKVTIGRPKRGGGFGWGLLLGVIIIAAGIIVFAYTQGSFQQAGVEADRASAQVQDTTGAAIDNAANSAEQAQNTQNQNTQNQTSDTATN